MIGQSITGKRDIVEELMHHDRMPAIHTVDVFLVEAISMLYFFRLANKVISKQQANNQ